MLECSGNETVGVSAFFYQVFRQLDQALRCKPLARMDSCIKQDLPFHERIHNQDMRAQRAHLTKYDLKRAVGLTTVWRCFVLHSKKPQSTLMFGETDYGEDKG